MRIPRWRGTAIVTAGMLIVALAGGADAPRVAAEPLTGPSTAQLRAALLTVANLPVGMGFQSQPLPSAAGVTSYAPCQFAAAGPQPTEQADIAFTGGSTPLDTVTVVEALQQYPVGAAVEQLQQAAEIVGHCNNTQTVQDGLHIFLNIEREAFPRYGNDTVALRLVSTIPAYYDLTILSDLVIVRHGGTVIVITNTADEQVFDPTLTRIAVAAAYKKVAALP
jgi:hypothetical protein